LGIAVAWPLILKFADLQGLEMTLEVSRSSRLICDPSSVRKSRGEMGGFGSGRHWQRAKTITAS